MNRIEYLEKETKVCADESCRSGPDPVPIFPGWRGRVRIGCLFLIAAAVLASCSRAVDSGSAVPGVPGPGSPAPAAPQVPALRFPEGGRVEVVRGETGAWILRGAERFSPEPGTLLALGDRVRTDGTGSAEIRLGQTAAFLLLPGSEAELRAARLSPGAAWVEVFVASGSALFDVRPLSPGESFLVSAPGILSGVRGTRYLVTAGTVSATGVQEGRVAVLPSGPVLGRLTEAARTDAAARAALRALFSLAPVAEPGREIRVDEPALDRAENAYALLESALSGLPPVPLPPDFPEEPWFAASVPELPAPDPGSRDALARAREAAEIGRASCREKV